MPNISEMTGSTYLKQHDVTPPKVVTIKSLRQENLAKDDQPPKLKWIMFFQEFDKGLALNSTNIKRCAKALLSDETEEWLGKKIKLYFDENVEFGGQMVGGIRITRAGTVPAKPAEDDIDN